MSVKVSYKSNHGIQGSYDVPLDKSIAQRSAILGLSTNTGVEGEDIVSTKKAAKQIRSGADNLCLDMGNSGTGMRLMAGFIAGLGIDAELVGDESLSNRPMERIAKPLREMGAGDTGVHIKIKKMINSYMGRQKFYMQCLEKNDFSTLKIHIIKNVYRNVDNSDYSPELLTNYCQLCFEVLEEISEDYLLTNKFEFPEYKQDVN